MKCFIGYLMTGSRVTSLQSIQIYNKYKRKNQEMYQRDLGDVSTYLLYGNNSIGTQEQQAVSGGMPGLRLFGHTIDKAK